MRILTALVLAAALVAGVPSAPAEANSDYQAPIPLSFPVKGKVSYTDSFDAGRSGGRAHKATDIMVAKHGQAVHAAVGGRITYITGLDNNPPSSGYMIFVRGDDGRTYEYIHMGRQNGPASQAYAKGLRRGSRVEQGQYLGTAGSSGNASASAPHLHFGIRDPEVKDPYGSNYRNPYKSLKRAESHGVSPAASPAPRGPVVLAGDFNGDGRATPVRFEDGRFRVCDDTGSNCAGARTVRYGSTGDLPVVGDWDGDGVDGIGIVRGKTWHLRQTASGGKAELSFAFGKAGDEPIVGDWNGDGRSTPGLRRDGHWFLRTQPGGGKAQLAFAFGKAADDAVAGDWDGDGQETVGIVRGKSWHVNDRNGGGKADRSFRYGASGDEPVTGDWAASGHDGVGVVRSNDWHLRDDASGGGASRSVTLR